MTFTKEEARTRIQKLVEDFRTHESTLEKAAEAQIENNFIRPLFRYLNWNTENEGLSHAHYEFKVQVTNKKGLRPDYILNVDGRDVLVMDAKQVKYSMKDPRWLYQVYSYAYSTQNSKPSEKMDFAILTDFQEFIVLDCTLFAAKPEAVNNFRVLDWAYTDYVEKFDELWELLERNNVMNDSKERKSGLWARYLSPQKVKSNRIAPDKAFLTEMDDEKNGWRVLLAKDMKKHNKDADGELITAAVQLLIDRLVFIKALSDREVDKDYLGELAQTVESSGLSDNDTGWFQACQTIFDELNNFYNGSIFAPRPELEHVTVSNKVVQSVIEDLQPENSPYNFAVLPVEILGTIYERFLGRVVRTTEKQVKIEEKLEVRKAGGVYYTPQYIVDYIVENTLGNLLKECKKPEDVAKLKVLDPSCGSGSFLLGAYDKLIEWHKNYFARTGKEKRDIEYFYRDESGQIRLTAKLKRDILKNNLFGVDIDTQAVEVTRFSLSLKALEDLREGELTEERTLFHQTVLPDLSQNIKNGNSLIGDDYFGLIAPSREELKTVKPFNWNTEFSEIMNNGGFDCIIGNPPWGASFLDNQLEYLRLHYKEVISRMIDSYIYLSHRALQINKDDGYIGFIVPSTILNQVDTKPIRGILLKRGLSHLISLGKDIFGTKVLNTSTIFICKKNDENITIGDLTQLPLDQKPDGLYAVQKANTIEWVKSVESDPHLTFFVNSFSTTRILEKLRKEHVLLQDILVGEIQRGISPDVASAHVLTLDEAKGLEKELLKPSVSGGQIKRYGSWKSDQFIIYTTRTTEIKKFPKTLKRLEEFREKNSCREVKENKHPWYSLHRPRNAEIFTSPKFIGLTTTKKIEIIYDEADSLFVTDAMYVFNIRPEVNPYVCMAIMSSKLFLFLYRIANQGESRVIPQVKASKLQTLPFPKTTNNKVSQNLTSLCKQMLELHKSKAGARTQAEVDVYERQIKSVDDQLDDLVYELYGLSKEDIEIIKNG
ncbi:MAG: N-6 DNA methylase [Anaerolineae bacterium]|nr:N-6 DNA methylase [Anaerolineae bacterium]